MNRRPLIASLVALELSGCGAASLDIDESKLVEGPPGWQEARATTCQDWGARVCPSVYFYGQVSFDCLDDNGNGYGWHSADGTCVESLTGSEGILVGVFDRVKVPSSTGMLHEIGHWLIEDPDHSDSRWWGNRGQDNYKPGTVVGDENLKLIASGL